mmetsp:Transcript_13252/g.22485  ORF Transcript_13252/g.22485 Transcript_13252/m.22485 type:complete len:251 (-) Transcript_13252:33-785(-)
MGGSFLARVLLGLLGLLLLLGDLGADAVEDLLLNHGYFAVGGHHAYLNVVGVLDHLHEGLDGQSNCLLATQVVFPLLLEELSQVGGVPPDGVGPPLVVSARGLGLEELGLSIIEACEEAGNSEGAHSALLGVLLLVLGHALDNVVDGGLVLEVEPEGLALDSGLVNENSGIGLQPRECAHDVPVHPLDLPDRSGVLQVGHWLLLHGQHHAVLALEGDGGCSSVDGLEGVLDLEELAVGGEDGDRFVVGRH